MTTTSTPNPKSAGTAAPNTSGDCCSNTNRIEPLPKVSKVSDKDAGDEAATKATDACCCGGNKEVKASYPPT